MDNLDKIKFKESVPGWLFKIDDSGKTEFKKGTKFIEELQKWEESGNEIEQQYTADETVAKEEDELAEALESQKKTCINLLNESECKVGGDPPYPDDVDTWKTFRNQLRVIIKSVEVETIPEKPFQ